MKSDINPAIEAKACPVLFLYTHPSYYWRQEYGAVPKGAFYLIRDLRAAIDLLRQPKNYCKVTVVPEMI